MISKTIRTAIWFPFWGLASTCFGVAVVLFELSEWIDGQRLAECDASE